jgi:TorA maturation chaperone TorD
VTAAAVTTGRWELLRALGAVADAPAGARAAGPALGLEAVGDAEHTDVFVLNLPPYASVYLGPDGALGGEGADRVAGFWRAIGMSPPAEPDHLSALLGLYASLGEASADARRAATAAALARSQASLLAEHLWPWLPGYLDAVTDLAAPALAGWARLARQAIAAESRIQPACPRLPLALRQAPPPPVADAGVGALTAALTTPVCSGMILTRHRLAFGAGEAGVGHRIGERRFALRAMLEQDPAATLRWLALEAGRWQQRHAARGAGDQASQWWAARAARTRQYLRGCGAAVTRR